MIRSRAVIGLTLFAVATTACPSPAAEPSTNKTTALSLTVLAPDGQPAAGARAVLVPADHFLLITNGRTFDDDPEYTLATADAAGRLTLPGPTAPFGLCVLHGSGEFDFSSWSAWPSPVIRLDAWGHVSGQARVGPTPAGGQAIQVQAGRYGPAGTAAGPRPPRMLFMTESVADAEGRYSVDRVPVGEVGVTAPTKLVDLRRRTNGPITFVTMKPRSEVKVDLGGRGRVVTGRVVVPPALTGGQPHTIDFGTLSAVLPPAQSPPAVPPGMTMAQIIAWGTSPEITRARAAWTEAQLARAHRANQAGRDFDIQPDGTFRIEDVLPGEYRFYAYVATPFDKDHTRRSFGAAQLLVTVPDDGSAAQAPLNLGDVTAARENDVAKDAFDFDVPTLDDRRVRLADYRGRYVLLNFWATWCGPCVAELPKLQAFLARHAGDPRLAMIGLCVDNTPERPIAFLTDHPLAWPQGFLGGTDDPVQKAYEVEAYPTTIVIGPDGKIVPNPKRLQAEQLIDELLAK